MQRFFSLMNEESPRKSLVKGERFVRHDDTSEGESYEVSAFLTTLNLLTLFAVVASLNLPSYGGEKNSSGKWFGILEILFLVMWVPFRVSEIEIATEGRFRGLE